MADYKRMVSYMYQYEKGVKKKNVGYARIESRNGQCKITLHMQLLGQFDSIFPTYLIQRDDKNTELIYLGDSQLKNQIMDSRLVAQENNIMGSGYRFSQMGGLLLFLNEDVFFATEWDDRPIVATDVLNSLKPKPDQSITQTEDETETDEGNMDRDFKYGYHYDNYEEMKAALLKGGAPQSEKGKNNSSLRMQKGHVNDDRLAEDILEEIEENDSEEEAQAEEDVRGKKTEMEIAIEESVKSEDQTTIKIEKESEEEADDALEMKASNLLKPVTKPLDPDQAADYNSWFLEGLNPSTPIYKMPKGWNSVERLQEKFKAAMDTEIAIKEKQNLSDKMKTENEEVKEAAGDDIIEKDMKNADEAQSQITEEASRAEIKSDEMQQKNTMSQEEIISEKEAADPGDQNNQTMGEEQTDNPLAAKIFENYPRIYPFEDNEITLCVKIEPKDIGFLPMSAWVLNSNSFLLHGYYCYRHLIFAKLNDKFGSRYILGVPGIYHNRERFMARMFGFEQFKSIRKRELRQGDFGYWYITINM